MPSKTLVAIAEESARAEISGLWDTHSGMDGRFSAQSEAKDRMRATGTYVDALPMRMPVPRNAHPRTNGATYVHDGTLEGLFSAVHDAFMAHDAAADIQAAADLQPRLGQTVVDVATSMDVALKVRRLVEHDLGRRAFQCILSAAAADDPAKGTAIYRFIRHGMAEAGAGSCTRCRKKAMCTRACRISRETKWIEDLAQPEVHAVVALYRSVVNERHLMLQFMRFEHCEGDVWFARCNPKSSVVPLLMDWFIARFNDQRFVIYDEVHRVSGVYDGSGWYLVSGEEASPPPHMEDERMMRAAWRRFYRCLAIDDRYHPELRRGFMPMRLWGNLPEMQPE